MAAPTRIFTGSGRTLAAGVCGILALGLATGVVAEILTPDRPGLEAAASRTTPHQQRDSETKLSLVAISEAVETYYVQHAGPLTLEQGHTEAVLGSDGEPVATVELADGTRIDSFRAFDYSTWCVDGVNEHGTGRVFSVDAEAGIRQSPC